MGIPNLKSSSKEKFPNNLDAETACIGAILIKNKLIDQIFSSLKTDDFYDERNQIIVKAILEYREKNGYAPIDILTLKNILEEKDLLQKAGGVEYITKLIDSVPSSTNTSYYSNIIKEKSILRQVIDIFNNNFINIFSGEMNSSEIIEKSQQELFDISKSNYREYEKLRDVFISTLEVIEENYKNKGSVIGIQSGYRHLDNIIGGFHNENLIIIGGRPAMGKTAFALSIIQNISISSKINSIPIGFFSLEMSKSEICVRLLCAEAKLNGDKFRKNTLIESDWEKIIKAGEKLTKAPIFIDDTPSITINELSAKARKMVQEGAKIIFIDYLQLMGQTDLKINREQHIANISRRLKAMARELCIPMVALTQLNRATEARHNKRPLLSDIRESGAIEQDADLVFFCSPSSLL